MNEKEMTRQMYGFEPGESFELFNEGITVAHSGSAPSAAELFEKSIAIEPSNPFAHMYLVMMYEFMHKPNDVLKEACLKWVEAAKSSHKEQQIHRATESLKFYSATDEERKAMRKEFGKMFRDMRNGRK
jgi:hypothetical protein